MSIAMNSAARLPTVLLALLCAAASLAQDGAAPPQPAATPPPRPAATPAPAEPPAEAPRDGGAEAGPPAERPDVNDEEFIPTEELAPDAAVTFPVNI